MTTWNDIDIKKARIAVASLKLGDIIFNNNPREWLEAVDRLEDFFNKLELLKQKEIKVCRILQKP